MLKARVGDHAATEPSPRFAPTRHVNCDPHDNGAGGCHVVSEAGRSPLTSDRPNCSSIRKPDGGHAGGVLRHGDQLNVGRYGPGEGKLYPSPGCSRIGTGGVHGGAVVAGGVVVRVGGAVVCGGVGLAEGVASGDGCGLGVGAFRSWISTTT